MKKTFAVSAKRDRPSTAFTSWNSSQMPNSRNGLGRPRRHSCIEQIGNKQRGRSAIGNVPLRETRQRFSAEGGRSPKGKGGVPSRTTGAEGHPVCTSEVLGARKIGEEAAPGA